jgi:hypothetical protein
MSLIEKNREPGVRELKWFGLLLGLFFLLIGALIGWQTGSRTAGIVLATIGLSLAAIYYAVPPLRRTIFLVWMALVYPIGWTISHLVLALTYYLVLTPIGLMLRWVRDPMQRSFDASAATYWTEHDPASDPKRYFRQF